MGQEWICYDSVTPENESMHDIVVWGNPVEPCILRPFLRTGRTPSRGARTKPGKPGLETGFTASFFSLAIEDRFPAGGCPDAITA